MSASASAVAGGREAWLAAGQRLLRVGGVVAVKLDALTATTGLTTGSFYHHFRGMKEYLKELAGFYGSEQVRANVAAADSPDPRERLARLVTIATTDRMRPLDAAMRDWAGSNPVAADAVRAADAHLMKFVAKAFEDLGHRPAEARLRAHMLQSYGVARVMPPWKVRAGDVQRMLDILARLA